MTFVLWVTEVCMYSRGRNVNKRILDVEDEVTGELEAGRRLS